jgi:hypothetical protein
MGEMGGKPVVYLLFLAAKSVFHSRPENLGLVLYIFV